VLFGYLLGAVWRFEEPLDRPQFGDGSHCGSARAQPGIWIARPSYREFSNPIFPPNCAEDRFEVEKKAIRAEFAVDDSRHITPVHFEAALGIGEAVGHVEHPVGSDAEDARENPAMERLRIDDDAVRAFARGVGDFALA